MQLNRKYLLIAAVFGLLISGCAQKLPTLNISPGEEVLLSKTPFYPQEEYQCGPTSLAMLLGASGIEVHPDALKPLTYLPERQGSLQVELIGASRRYHRIAYEIDPEISAILAELKNGRPVLVLQNYGLKSLPAYHYAVVIGVTQNTLILRSGTTETLHMDAARFMMSWVRANGWGIILLKPGELPENLDVHRYIKAVNGYERIGDKKLAETAYIAGLSQHPDAQSLLFALGNNYLAQSKLIEAETQFRKILKTDPQHIAAANNFAETLFRRECGLQALAASKLAVENALAQNSPLLKIAIITHREIKDSLTEKAEINSPVVYQNSSRIDEII